MTTFSDSDEITGNELVTTDSVEDEEIDSNALADEILNMEKGENEINEKIEDIEDDIDMLKDEDVVAIDEERKEIEGELDKEAEMLDEAKGDLEDEVAGFVGV